MNAALEWSNTPPSKTPCLVFDGYEVFVAWRAGRNWMTTGAVEVVPLLYAEIVWPPDYS